MSRYERPFYQPFPDTPWDRHYGEKPEPTVFPTTATTTLLDPLERAILGNRRLLQLFENSGLSLPPRWTGSADLIKVYEPVGNFLTAARSKERHQARRQVDRLLESDEEVLLLDKLLTAQPKLSPQLAEVKVRADELVKPPTDFRVLALFQPHEVKTPEQGQNLRSQIVTAGRNLFGKEDDNVFFLEDSYSDFFENPDFYEAVADYGSVRKAYSFVAQKNQVKLPESFSKLSGKRREIIDELLELHGQRMDIIAENPHVDPQRAYVWTQLGAIDDLMADKYPVRILWEHGKITDRWINKEDTTPETMMEALMHNISLLETRTSGESDKGIAEQLTDLERNKDKSKQTNVFMIFGSEHVVSVNYVPNRLRTVITHSYR